MKLALLINIFVSIYSNWNLSNSLVGEYQSVEVDEQGDIYLINLEKQLVKLNPQLDTLYIFNEKSAEVEFVAPQNALKVLTFNKSLNTIQFLDKTLSPSVEELNLDDVGVPLVEAIGMSKDNNFWLFDQYNQSLKKFDTKSNLISSSGNVMNLTGDNWTPIRLKEVGNKVFLNDSIKGILEFDFFGSYVGKIDIQIKSNFYFKENAVWFLRSDSLIAHDLLLHEESKFYLPFKNIKDFAFYKSHFYFLTQEKFYIYGFSK